MTIRTQALLFGIQTDVYSKYTSWNRTLPQSENGVGHHERAAPLLDLGSCSPILHHHCEQIIELYS